MRILRLHLANYRATEACEVHFRRNGLTVVVGPNEAGKTSLAESLLLLFDHLDSTSHRDVRAVKPVNRDAGPEIELDVESGPYAFTYRKRFLKRPETVLMVTRPRQENLTGREAHERAAAILGETLDVDLWRALLVEQGRAYVQADLSHQAALSAALDRAAGGTPGEPRGETLYEGARAERDRYYTEKGIERKELQNAREAADDATAEVEVCRRLLAEVHRDIARAARLGDEGQGLELRVSGLRDRVAEHDRARVEIEALEGAVEKARLRHESAAKSQGAAARDVAERGRLVSAAASAKTASDLANEACGALGPELRQAQDVMDEAELARGKAEGEKREAEALAELRRVDAEYFRSRLDLEQLRERKERVDRARVEAARAREVLVINHVDDRRLAVVEETDRAVEAAEARLQSGAPTLYLRALGKIRIEIGGRKRSLKEGTEETISVPERARIVVPDALELEVVAGASLTGLQRKLEDARKAFEEARTAVKVASVKEARQANRDRQEAVRAIARLKEVEKADLRDLTYEQLETKILGLAKHVPEYPLRRSPVPDLPEDLDDARRVDAAARNALQVAGARADEVRDAFERARTRRDRLQREAGDREAERRAAEGALKRAEEELAEARRGVTDVDLDTRQVRAVEDTGIAAQDLTAARETLARKDPEKTRALLAADSDSLRGAESQLATVRREAGEVRRRLDSMGEAGLHERLETAEAQGESACARREDLLRRAAGALLLFETIRFHREAVRRRYLGPLRERVEALGRILFDETFRVDVDEDLRLASRTLREVTVPFQDLSTGTKEQLSLIARVACAMMVSEEGGPLLLDDVLGHTDPERLAAMGAILRLGGERCQIVLLTSVPERYAHVGDAEIVRLGQFSGLGGT